MTRWLCLILVPVLAQSADLAPTGTLRVAFLGQNPVQGKVDPATGNVTGPVADLVKELARRLNVPYKFLPEAGARRVIDALKSHQADIGFLADDPARAAEVDFSHPYLLMFNAYIVRADSPIQKTADADQPGLRVAAVRGQTQQLYLSETLKRATVKIFETMPPQAELERLFEAHEVDAFGVNRQRAEQAAAESPNLRALADNFLTVEQDIIVEKGPESAAKLADINRFIREILVTSLVKDSIEHAKIAGVAVATNK